MTAARIFLPSVDPDKPLEIDGENAKYLLSVLRMSPGDVFTVFDESGCGYKAEIRQTLKKERLYARVMEALPPEPETETGIVLLQGILKGQKMDLVVQKTTELGIKGIVPLITQRTQVRQTGKRQRWQKIALEASRQSGRPKAPEVAEPVGIGEFFSSPASLKGLFFWEEGGISINEAFPSMRPQGGAFYVVIGPEGGFTEEEARLGKEKGLTVSTLGRRMLRAETAAISAVTIVQFMLGEMG